MTKVTLYVMLDVDLPKGAQELLDMEYKDTEVVVNKYFNPDDHPILKPHLARLGALEHPMMLKIVPTEKKDKKPIVVQGPLFYEDLKNKYKNKA